MDTNDKNDQNYQLSTTDTKNNDETKDLIEPDKQPCSSAAKIETALFASIAAVPIVATKYIVFQSAQVPDSLSSISTSRKPPHIAEVTVIATRSHTEIMSRWPIEKGKQLFQPVTTTFLSSDKEPASLSYIYVPRKQSPLTTDYIITIVDIVGPEFS